MKNNKQNILLIFFLIIFILPITLASTEYTQLGNNNDFVLGESNFNSLVDASSSTKNILNPIGTVLVGDMDNDGIVEIIVQDGANLKLFQSNKLNPIDTFTMSPYVTPIYSSNALLFDIDGDNLTEFIVVSERSNVIHVVEYNGSIMTGYTIPIGITHSTGEVIIGCEGIDKCMIVGSQYIDITTGIFNQLSARMFNSTNNLDVETVLDSGTSGFYKIYCQPKIRTMTITDIDNDNQFEYIISHHQSDDIGQVPSLRIRSLIVNNSNHIFEEDITTRSMYNFRQLQSGESCEDYNVGKYFTSPLVENLDNGISNGKEIVIGTMISINEYKMYVYNSLLNFIDDFPENIVVQDSEGIIVSNVFLGNGIETTGDNDFCILGHRPLTAELDISCGNLDVGLFDFSTKIYTLDTSNLFNISIDYGDKHILTHSIKTNNTRIEGNDLTEVLTSYGVISFHNKGLLCFTTSQCDASLLWENPSGSGVIISADVQKNGLEDIIALSPTNLWYYDDQFSNSPAEIDSPFIDPCINKVWAEGTNVEIRMDVVDIDGDTVQGRAVLYSDTEISEITQSLTYSGISVSVSAQTTSPEGGYFREDIGFGYLVDGATSTVYKYTENNVYTGISYVLSDTNNPKGLHFYNGLWYIPDDTGDSIDEYDENFVYQTTYSVAIIGNSVRGIHHDGTYWYLVEDQTNTVTQFNDSWVQTGISWIVGTEDSNPRDIAQDGNNNWLMLGGNTNSIYRYDSNFGYSGIAYEVSSEITIPISLGISRISSDPSNFRWIIIDDTTDRGYLYSASPTTTTGIDSDWTDFAPSGTTFTFPFTANLVKTNAKLSLYARDSINPNLTDSMHFTFSVAKTGVSQGDCVSEINVITSLEDPLIDVEDVISESELTETRNIVLDSLGIAHRWAILIGLLIILVSIFGTVALLTGYGIKDGMILLYLPIFMGFISWIFCVAFKLIPSWTVIVAILMSSAFIGFKFYFNRPTGSGGL